MRTPARIHRRVTRRLVPEASRHRFRTIVAALLALLPMTWLVGSSRAFAQASVVIITEGPRDRFDCLNPELSRKRYRTTEACLLDLCGDVYTADRTSLYVQHPRTRALVSNPCYMLDYSAR